MFSVARNTKRNAVVNIKPLQGINREGDDVMRVQSTATLAAFLACVVIAFIYSLAPLEAGRTFAHGILFAGYSTLPVWGKRAALMLGAAFIRAIHATFAFRPRARAGKLFTAIRASAFDGRQALRVGFTSLRNGKTFTRAITNARAIFVGLSLIGGDGLKFFAAYLTRSFKSVLLICGIACVTAKAAFAGRGILKHLAAVCTGGRHLLALRNGSAFVGTVFRVWAFWHEYRATYSTCSLCGFVSCLGVTFTRAKDARRGQVNADWFAAVAAWCEVHLSLLTSNVLTSIGARSVKCPRLSVAS
jgi:hypothetical protein